MSLVVVFIEEGIALMAQAADLGFGRAGLVLSFSLLCHQLCITVDKSFSLSLLPTPTRMVEVVIS